jgi:hypothetical protein
MGAEAAGDRGATLARIRDCQAEGCELRTL